MIAKIIAQVITALLSWAVTEIMKAKQNRDEKIADEKDIDSKLARYKEAYSKAHDGQPMTPEQIKELKDAFRDLVRG